MNRLSLTLLIVAVVLTVSACSSSGGASEPGQPAGQLVDDQQGSEPIPEALQLLGRDTTLIAEVPEVVYTQTLASSGIQVSYTDESLRILAPTAVIEKQWDFMQSCLGQVAPAPVVLVRTGPAVPLTPADDVVRNESALSLDITSVPIASTSTLHGVVIQVSIDDFDGSLGTPAFNLRSIMGRHLWLAANLPERDYPFGCAREQPA